MTPRADGKKEADQALMDERRRGGSGDERAPASGTMRPGGEASAGFASPSGNWQYVAI